jgi:hypothetical protein
MTATSARDTGEPAAEFHANIRTCRRSGMLMPGLPESVVAQGDLVRLGDVASPDRP